MRHYNIMVAGLSILMGGAIFWLSRDLTGFSETGVPGEAFWPSMIAGLFILLGLLQLAEVVFFPSVNAGRTVDLHSAPVRTSYVAALVALVFATIMTWLGFIIGAVLFIPAIMLLMGERRPLLIVGATVAIVAVIWFVFVNFFNITLPVAVFFE
ncbi:tripartite tricarboxylate transporter TctB family protein [Consotaella salsifontis]|uniref:Tripartite tricarboxylate transporter TctB family protein n=1 Tax=Consotaella salsifontis TaxID=1365950 RepID=A0A1T4S738_9HYPH|nr:tripartite tricarboxylate transporter TctB family protein [Consotaella salsifontis]SKA23967.1 Tripartite tricarboxylate transporter TctB family protein [Consotaella salsifontis]